MDANNTLDYYNFIVQCSIAIGTVAATVSALYFSSKNSNIKLKVNAEKAVEYGYSKDNDIDVISITISNIHFRKCIITEFYWKIPFRKAFYPELYNGRNSLRNILPILLNDGDQFYYNIPLKDFQRKGKIFASHLKCFPKIFVRFIKFGVYSSTKKEFEGRIGKELQKWILLQKAK